MLKGFRFFKFIKLLRFLKISKLIKNREVSMNNLHLPVLRLSRCNPRIPLEAMCAICALCLPTL